MGALTIYDALLGELEPYSPSSLTIRKALSDNGVNGDSVYDPGQYKRVVALSAIQILKKLKVLSSDSLGKSSQSYNVEAIDERIVDICCENGLEASEFVKAPSISDGSSLW